MQVYKECWTEKRTGRRYVGTCGYDDPIYEEYTYTENCSRELISFENSLEKYDFFKRICKFKSANIKIIIQETLEKEAKKAYKILQMEVDKDNKDFKEEYLKEVVKISKRNFLARWCCPQPSLKEISVISFDKFLERSLNISDEFITASIIQLQPDKYELFIAPLLKDDYVSIVKLLNQYNI